MVGEDLQQALFLIVQYHDFMWEGCSTVIDASNINNRVRLYKDHDLYSSSILKKRKKVNVYFVVFKV